VLVLALVLASGDWRSAFYLLALTTLVLPATALEPRRALLWGAAFTTGYLAVAVLTGLDLTTFDDTIRLETLATHLLVPMLVVLALAYGSDLLVRLRDEEERAKRLALETERRRIAWELHDSAKQRVHAAHLMLSSVRAGLDGNGGGGPLVDQTLAELQAATADMDTSVNELRAPLDGRPLAAALERRAAELRAVAEAEIEVRGDAPELPAALNAHAYRIAAEALLNAVRHSGARRIVVDVEARDGTLRVRVRDDGDGLPADARPGSHGIGFMGHRAATIGGRLRFERGDGGRGTTVALDVPLGEEADR
jgi:signal transduction histidine kinase